MNLDKLTLKAQESLQAAQQKTYENKHPQVAVSYTHLRAHETV